MPDDLSDLMRLARGRGPRPSGWWRIRWRIAPMPRSSPIELPCAGDLA
jgi:hypothetical protein